MATNSRDDGNEGNSNKLLPILIIPGFMSSGLEVRQSRIKPGWEGKRIWINLQSLGLESLYFGDAQKHNIPQYNNVGTSDDENDDDDDDDDDFQAVSNRQFKSAWLEHMILKDDMKTEANGTQIRAISGLEGVDYLSPGALTNHVSYVFGPVINALKKMGEYSEPKNLQAAPYDWRIPPTELEARDAYFTNTMRQVEELHENNENRPVILLCHSLGAKTCHYFINFCLARSGQDWLNKYVHTYLPVGGPHLGAPKAIRSVLSGDRMGLDTFLSHGEALSFGRSLGSGPWLFPRMLPLGAPACVYVKPQGVLELTIVNPINVRPLVDKRTLLTKPSRYQVAAALMGKPNKKRIVTTPFRRVKQGIVSFDTEKLYFATSEFPMQGASERFIQILLQEPGISVAKQEGSHQKFNPLKCCLKLITCCWICDLLFRLIRFLSCVFVQTLTLSADVISKAVGGSTTLAISDQHFLGDRVWSGERITAQLRLYHKDDIGRKEGGCMCCLCCRCCGYLVQPRTVNITIELRWYPYDNTRSKNTICSPIAQTHKPSPPSTSGLTIEKDNVRYQEFSGYDIIEREGLGKILEVVRGSYDDDVEMDPRTISSLDPPPVKRVHAIYGINLPTEVGGIYKRKDFCDSSSRMKNLYRLDVSAQVSNPKDGYVAKHGIVMETKTTKQQVADGRQVSGDGTVPYWSLQHVKSWQGPCEVSFVELDRAEHREILADARFHKALLDYCREASSNVPPLIEKGDETSGFEVLPV